LEAQLTGTTHETPKVALVTGAADGIGKASALALLAAGFRVVMAGRRLPALEQAIAEAGPESAQAALPISADVSDATAVARLFEQTVRAFGRIDVLFNNAGTNVPGIPFEDLSLDQWNTVMAVNLTGSFLCAQAAFRLMKAQDPRGGRIINNGSISAHVPRPDSAPYTASKHAITGLTRQIALDGRTYDIACSQIDIGNAQTKLSGRMAKGVKQADGRIAPEPMMDVAHVAEMVVSIARLPVSVNVPFMTVMATGMPYMGRG
jgi:NAD(P)-dependent dehydrogenase (short-subunit alcohol dehydrogenase family)